MRLIDTDHLSVLLETRHKQHDRLLSRLRSSDERVALPIVVVEEQLRSWLAQLHRVPDPNRQIVPYLRLQKLIEFVREWEIIGWNDVAADIFKRLRKQRIRIGTVDLKIAAIAIGNDSTLLSANLVDFEQVPGLRVEDWLFRS